MAWQIPVVLRLIAAYVITQPLAVVLMRGSTGSRTKKLVVMYGGALCAALLYAIWRGGVSVDANAAWLFGVGLMVSFGTYCWWGAAGYSLSKNAILTVWDDIIAMTFGLLLFNERRMLNGWVGAGVIISFVSLILFFRHSWRKKQENTGGNPGTPLKFYWYVAGYSVSWGLAAVAMRWFGTEGVTQSTFLLSWYGGTMAGAMLLLLAKCEIDPNCTAPLSAKDVRGSLLLAGMIVISLFLEYWSYAVAPLVVVRPIYLVGEQVIPVLVGLYFLTEAKQLERKEQWYFAMAIIGGFLLFFGEQLNRCFA